MPRKMPEMFEVPDQTQLVKLHRYFGSHADTTLSEGRLRLTHASSLNDPFEFFHQNVGNYDATQMEAFLSTSTGQEYTAGAWRKVVESGHAGIWAAELFSDPAALARHYVEAAPPFPNPDTMECLQIADENLRICCFTNPYEVRPMVSPRASAV